MFNIRLNKCTLVHFISLFYLANCFIYHVFSSADFRQGCRASADLLKKVHLLTRVKVGGSGEQSSQVKGRSRNVPLLKCLTFNDQTSAKDEGHFVLLALLASGMISPQI